MIPIHAKQFWDFVPLFDWFGKPVAQAARPCSWFRRTRASRPCHEESANRWNRFL